MEVKFDYNYQLVGDSFKYSADRSSPTAEALYLMLNFLRYSNSTKKLAHVLKDTKCIKTDIGSTDPYECYLPGPKWGAFYSFSTGSLLYMKFFAGPSFHT